MAASFVMAAPAAAADVAVDIVNFEYVPNPIQVDPGDTITFTNSDPGPHTVTADDGSFSLLMDAGQSATLTIDEAGVIPFFCKLHGGPGGNGMAGVIQSGPPPEPERFTAAGADNTAVAISWSQASFADDSSGFALLGRADLFADALASGVGQATLDAPLLLTASDVLDPRTKAELDRLGVQTVYLMGGRSALSQGVEDALRAAGFGTRRVAGGTRIETAIEAARTFVPEARSALLSRASAANDPNQGFVDALGAGAVGAATGQAVLFSETAKLSDSTKAYLGANPIDSVTIVGGELALSRQVQADLEAMGIEVDRVSGGDRYQTAAAVAQLIGGEEQGPAGVVLVDGTDPNAWADGFAAAGRGQPVLLSSGDDLPTATLEAVVFLDPFGTGLACGDSAAGAACSRAEAVLGAMAADLPAVGTFASAEEEVPPTDHPAAGLAGIFPGNDASTVCYDYFGIPVEDFAAAHIHKAAEGTDGPAVVPLNYAPTEEGLLGCSFGVDAAVLADVLANPGDYYVNIHTTSLPDGAIRGQLFVPSMIAIGEAIGEAEVPPVESDGLAFSFLLGTDDPGEICAPLFVENPTSDVTAAHIHRGASGEEGSAVMPYETPQPQFPGSFASVACYDVGQALVDEIRANPAGFYLNVHTANFPDGELRGQLFNPFGG